MLLTKSIVVLSLALLWPFAALAQTTDERRVALVSSGQV